MATVELKFFEASDREAFAAVELEPEQGKFTAFPHEVLPKLVDPERHLTLMIHDNQLVGYFVLHENNGPLEIGSHDKALLIRSLGVDRRHQRKGYAYQGMKQLPDFVRRHFPQVTELVLLVNLTNLPAQGLYQKVGFTDTGIRRKGRSGMQALYHYLL